MFQHLTRVRPSQGQISDNYIILINANFGKVGVPSFKYFLGLYLTLLSNALFHSSCSCGTAPKYWPPWSFF